MESEGRRWDVVWSINSSGLLFPGVTVPRGWVVALCRGRHGGGCPGFGAPAVSGECYRSFRGTPEQAAMESGSPVFKTWREVGVIEDNAIATAINKRELSADYFFFYLRLFISFLLILGCTL